jgi:hypothetical protein
MSGDFRTYKVIQEEKMMTRKERMGKEMESSILMTGLGMARGSLGNEFVESGLGLLRLWIGLAEAWGKHRFSGTAREVQGSGAGFHRRLVVFV